MLQHVWEKEAERRDEKEDEFEAFERRRPPSPGNDAGWHEPDGEYIRQKLSLDDWLTSRYCRARLLARRADVYDK